MANAFVRNLIEKALYECMNLTPSDCPVVDHQRRIEVWERAMDGVAIRCGEVAEGYAAKHGLVCEEDQAICDGIREALNQLVKNGNARTSGS